MVIDIISFTFFFIFSKVHNEIIMFRFKEFFFVCDSLALENSLQKNWVIPNLFPSVYFKGHNEGYAYVCPQKYTEVKRSNVPAFLFH